jgi:hypothetical protein
MSSTKREPDIGMRQIVSGAILLGLINLLPMAFVHDILDNKTLWDNADPRFFEHYWLYGAISAMGTLLAWSMPNSMIAWKGRPVVKTIIPLSIIGTTTSGILYGLIRANVNVLTPNLIILATGMAVYILVLAVQRRLKPPAKSE